ncbi:MAG: flagellar export chaperone FliS [bacterium]
MNMLKAYEQTNRTTASPKQALLLLYDHAISNLAQCEHIVVSNQGRGAYKHLVKAQEIITGLANGLSYEGKLQEISTRLFSLYQHMMVKLSRINLEGGDTSILAEVRRMLEELREAWGRADARPQ